MANKIKHLGRVMSLFLGLLLLLSFQPVYALEVKLVTDTSNADEIQIGTAPISIVAEVTGTKLTFLWRLVGVGRLEGEGDGEAVLYVPPENIEGDLAKAIISVKVEDYRGEEVTKSVTFRICENCELGSATPMPQQTPTDDELPIPDDAGTSRFIFKKMAVEQPYLIVSRGSGGFPEISGGDRRTTEQEKERVILIFNGKTLRISGLKLTNWNENIVQLVKETFPQAQYVAPNESVRPGTDVVSIDGIDYWGNATVVRANFPEKILEVVSGNFHKP